MNWLLPFTSHRPPAHVPQQQLPPEVPSRQPQTEPKLVAQPNVQPKVVHIQASGYGQNHVQTEQPHKQLYRQPLGFNSDPSPSASDASRAPGAPAAARAAGDSLDASFRNMLLNNDDDNDVGWESVGANKPVTNGTASETRLPRKKKAVAPRFAALQHSGRPTSQPSSQAERPSKVPLNGAVAGESSASTRTVTQAPQLSQPAWPEVRKFNSGTQNGAVQVKPKVFKNSAWSGGQNRVAQSQEPKQKAKPTVAYVAAVTEPVTWDNRTFDETRRSTERGASSSPAAINNINFGLDLYKALTSDDESVKDRPKDATKLTDALRVGFAQAGYAQAAAEPTTAAEQTTAGSKFGPIGSRPPDKPKLSYSDALRNGHTNGFVAQNAKKH